MQPPVYFEIQASDPKILMDFYHQIFGWDFAPQPGTPVEYYSIAMHGHELGGLLKRPAQIPPLESGTNAFTCSFDVKSFDEKTKQILALGGSVAFPKFAITGKCYQGYFTDPDHNVFGIFEPNRNAK
jgi:hypothetical protein